MQYTLGGIGSESQAWSKLKHQPAFSIGASTREAEHKRMFGTSHGSCTMLVACQVRSTRDHSAYYYHIMFPR
jgi:hypothetical protein